MGLCTALCHVLVLGSGAHIVANAAESHMAMVDPTATSYELLYWAHEYLAHRLFALGSYGLWLNAAVNHQSRHATTLSRKLVFVAVVQGLAAGFFAIGTRTASTVAAPAAMLLLGLGIMQRGERVVCTFAAITSAASLVVYSGWLVAYGGSMPTFDDLRDPSDSAPA